jgi:hypothetical protein
MTDQAYNPNDPEFLMSRDLDQDLSENERRRLQEAADHSPALRAQAAQLCRLDQLLRRWGDSTHEAGSRDLAPTIVARLAREQAESPEIDRILTRWAATDVNVENDFASAVMARLRAERRQPVWSRRVLRIGAPLAAAAAIAIAVTAGLWSPPEPKAVVRVVIREAAYEPAPAPSRVVVSFVRRIAEPDLRVAARADVSFMTVGTSWPDDPSSEVPPL